MSQQKEKTGGFEGTLTSGEPIPLYHSPEDEEKMKRLLQALMPRITELVVQNINFDEGFQDNYGDFVQIVYNIINQFITNIKEGDIYNEILAPYKGGDGINISGLTIKVDLVTSNPGLEISSEKLDVKAGDGITTDTNGTKIELDTEWMASAAGPGLELSAADGTGKLKVVPTDFLKTS